MQNDDVVRILNKIRDQIDEEKQMQINPVTEAYNDGLIDAMAVIEAWSAELSLTPNQIKRRGGMYYN